MDDLTDFKHIIEGNVQLRYHITGVLMLFFLLRFPRYEILELYSSFAINTSAYVFTQPVKLCFVNFLVNVTITVFFFKLTNNPMQTCILRHTCPVTET